MGRKRFCICGIGNRLYGDDGVGPASLDEIRKQTGDDCILFIDCGRSASAHTKKIISFLPDVIIIISSVEMGRTAGAVEELGLQDAKGALESSHKVEAQMLIGYLEKTTKADIRFIGVQPENTRDGDGISPACRGAMIIIRGIVTGIMAG